MRVTREQNAVIEKLNEQVVALGGQGIEDLPKMNTNAVGVSARRARHHRQRKKPQESKE